VDDQFILFEKILNILDEHGALKELALIGSWCLPIYQQQYIGFERLEAIRTTDIDFFVPAPNRIDNEVNVSKLLQGLGFAIKFDSVDGFEKFIMPELEVEFLAPRKRSNEKISSVPKLNIKTLSLNYLETIPNHLVEITYLGHSLRIPELPFFMLHKAMIQTMRKTEFKKEKDARIVQELARLVLIDVELCRRAKQIYNSFGRKWKQKVQEMAAEHSADLEEIIR
jgi:hypothetical protein